jgi:tetraacyldisaccharide 4'-kinase
MKQKFPEITVAVDGNRVRGINKLIEADKQLKIILLDDAYQHRYVTPGVSILLVDYNRQLKDDRMLPAGMLRESSSEIRRADIIVVTKCPNKLKPIEQRLLEKDLKSFAYQKIYFTTLDYGQPKPVYKNFAKPITHDQMRDSKPTILFITGIANARPFKTHIRGISTKIEEINYPDHYNYSAKDMHYIMEKFISIDNPNKYIITTEKDAMRFQLFDDLDDDIKNVMYYIPIEVQFLEEESRNFNQQILNYVRNNKSDSILYKKQDKK